MASSKYIVDRMNWDPYRHKKTKKDDTKGDRYFKSSKTKKRVLISNNTQKKYKNHAIKFLDWCKTTYGTNKPKYCRKHIQEYANYLSADGKSSNTIHDYIVGVCRIFSVPLRDINLPKRIAAENTNNRRANGPKAVDSRSDANPEYSPKLVAIASVVGVRRAEYKNLRKNDFTFDEAGWPCIRVRKGKNGKKQLQRIPAESAEILQSFFDGSDAYLFTANELRNKINLHRIRGEVARKWYAIYAHKIMTEPGYEIALREKLRKRYEECGVLDQKWNSHEMTGKYKIRGANRIRAIELGLPTEYYRLAVMAVSVFHLSHWRNNVTVSNYLLAV